MLPHPPFLDIVSRHVSPSSMTACTLGRPRKGNSLHSSSSALLSSRSSTMPNPTSFSAPPRVVRHPAPVPPGLVPSFYCAPSKRSTEPQNAQTATQRVERIETPNYTTDLGPQARPLAPGIPRSASRPPNLALGLASSSLARATSDGPQIRGREGGTDSFVSLPNPERRAHRSAGPRCSPIPAPAKATVEAVESGCRLVDRVERYTSLLRRSHISLSLPFFGGGVERRELRPPQRRRAEPPAP